MQFEEAQTGTPTEVFQALEAVEPSQAAEVLTGLGDSLHGKGADPLDLRRAWKAFTHLLERRGYYVDTPARLAASLGEIIAIGAGFDLYELARSLARYDAIRTGCRGLSNSRSIPELFAFSADCPCLHHRKEK